MKNFWMAAKSFGGDFWWKFSNGYREYICPYSSIINEFVKYLRPEKRESWNSHQSINSVQTHSTFKPKTDSRYRWTEKGAAENIYGVRF